METSVSSSRLISTAGFVQLNTGLLFGVSCDVIRQKERFWCDNNARINIIKAGVAIWSIGPSVFIPACRGRCIGGAPSIITGVAAKVNYRVGRCTLHLLGLIFPWVDISTVGMVPPVPKTSALETSRVIIELSENRIVRCWDTLGCRAIERGKPFQRCVISTVVYGILPPSTGAPYVAISWRLTIATQYG